VQVSPVNDYNNWWANVAVDSLGQPHVVWCETEHSLIYYSFYNGSDWTAPTAIIDTTQVVAADWADPGIVIDRAGTIHVCFTGNAKGVARRDVFYTRNDGSGWQPCVKVTNDTLSNVTVWYSDIAASEPDNVWVTWNFQGSWPEQFRIFASHFDGASWSAEARLDDDSAYDEEGPRVALDVLCNPWVVWDGASYSTGNYTIYYNRLGDVGAREMPSFPKGIVPLTLGVSSPCVGGARFVFGLPLPARVVLDIYDRVGRRVNTIAEEYKSAGRHSILWNGTEYGGQKASSGVYVCCLRAGKNETASRFALLAR
jgi:hypothetical protein